MTTWYTYINIVSELGLEGVGALVDPPIQIVALVDGQVVGADRGHGKATNAPHTRPQLYTLTVGPLAHARHSLLPANVIGGSSARHYASISRQGFRVTHLVGATGRRHSRVVLGGLTTTATAALLRKERVWHCANYPSIAAHSALFLLFCALNLFRDKYYLQFKFLKLN